MEINPKRALRAHEREAIVPKGQPNSNFENNVKRLGQQKKKKKRQAA